MSGTTQTVTVGQIQVTQINIGNIYLPLADHLNVPEKERQRLEEGRALATQTTLPINCTLLQLPQAIILVDAGLHDMVTHAEYALPAYSPPPSLSQQLSAIGIPETAVDHVIITHRHWDHFNGTTKRKNGQFVPQYPNARYHLSRIDWERSEERRNDPTTVENKTLRVLDEHQLLDQVDGDQTLVDGVHILAAPGETRGHQIVKVHDGGETLFCLGDLYHHPIEFIDPKWMVGWARPETTINSRQQFIATALAEDARLIATHIPEIGRLRQTTHGIRWAAA